MDGNGFAAMVARAMKQQGLSAARLSILMGVLEDGRVVDRTTLDRIRHGQRRHHDPAIVARLVEVLNLEPSGRITVVLQVPGNPVRTLHVHPDLRFDRIHWEA